VSTLTRAHVWVMAAAAALSVANLYYNQPLLAVIARDLHVSERAVGFVPTLTQAGYAAGLLFIVPIGDIVDRKRLVLASLVAVTLALVGVTLSRGLTSLGLASFAVGATTIAPQLVLPLAAALAPPAERGRVVGTIMAGLLIGILGARTVAGVAGAAFGWRAVYGAAAVVMALLAVVLGRALPTTPTGHRLSYVALLRSLGTLFVEEPGLREAALFGACAFAGFSAFWSTLVFFLETPPYHYGSSAAGLFGLVGIAGALAARAAGRISDKRGPRFGAGLALATALLSWIVFAVAGRTLAGLVAGVVLLDLGAQGNQVSNQTRIYALRPEAHNRVNTVYMTIYFVGGAAGTMAGTWAWSRFGWNGVCAVGGGAVAVALAQWLRGRSRAR
jgi:predicted MFS family arabinose efflux permease